MNDATCSVSSCPVTDGLVRGWCKKHYTRFLRHGDPLGGYHRDISIVDRLAMRVEVDGDCHIWTGSANESGYGHLRYEGREQYAHRVAYTVHVGPIPAGKVLDHLCRRPSCINPQHLEPVDQRENVLRGLSPQQIGAFWRAKTHCPQGHPYDETNTYHIPTGGRGCRECGRARCRRAYWRRKLSSAEQMAA